MDDKQINHWSINLKINNLHTKLARFVSVNNCIIVYVQFLFKCVIMNFAKQVKSDN